MANYTNTANVSKFLQRSLTDSENSALTSFILAAVDKWIDRKLETTFAKVSEATTRYFDGGGRSIDIDPCQSITDLKSVNNDGSDSYLYTENTEFVFEPVNETIKREIVYRGYGHFPRGQRRMAVTAKFTEYDFENDTVPQDIIMAATRLATGILVLGKTTGQGNVKREALEGHMIEYDTSLLNISATADADPILQGMLAERRQLYLYDDCSADDW